MKLLSVLISFCLGSKNQQKNIKILFIETYIKAVINTNEMPQVIQNIIRGTYTMAQISYMLAVIPEPRYYTLSDMLRIQLLMQEEINNETEVDAPQIDGEIFVAEVNLPVYGQARRVITKHATKALISSEIDANQHRIQPIKYFKDSLEMCRLLGLFRSIKYPNNYIIDAVIDETETCTLTDLNSNRIRYVSVADHIWSLNSNNELDMPFDINLA
ncbi:uncharacterized protein LOC126835170 isoform X3 [Adelges cooleyi]|uniref:uncharacterized protein LOC126835170 isoform X3 n=1 Tax=Adelges cooleyi TaxID=133065 RepID=UPI002180578A|nr:uncharacterized protein LOC126835170 isoform X3 [Adelges cooleyi]